MPDARLVKARDSLPEGYQFGDAGKPAIRMRSLKRYDIQTNQIVTRQVPDETRPDDGRCPDCGQPADLMSLCSEPVIHPITGLTTMYRKVYRYCPNAFHFVTGVEQDG